MLLGVSYDYLKRTMFKMGFENTDPNFVLNSETASLIALEYNMNPIVSMAEDVDLKPREKPESWSEYPPRAPVVTIMGHVDHGKTTLLDALRKTSVAAGEAGGITQHIGAFEVVLPSNRRITFMDTPGHEAFSAMRARGAQATDIAILVVAGDDGVMPQTVEAIKHVQEADVAMIVAITKCDKPGVNIKKVQEGLLQHNVVVEDYGGEVPCVKLSAVTGEGLDELEETTFAVADLLDIRGDPEGPVEGVVIESKLHRGKGPVASVLVQRGTLKPGSIVVSGTSWCKVRMMSDENGRSLQTAGPSVPCEIMGWKTLPVAGDLVLEAENEDLAKKVIESRQSKIDRQEIIKSIDDLNEKRMEEKKLRKETSGSNRRHSRNTSSAPMPTMDQDDGIPTLYLVLKADVHGSLEALEQAIAGLPSHEVRPNIVHAGVGPVLDSDVNMAVAAKATILAFNVPTDKKTVAQARRNAVPIVSHNIIYHLLDSIKELMSELLPPEQIQETKGTAEIAQIFSVSVKASGGGKVEEKVAGCKVTNGKILRNGRVKILRSEEVVFDGTLSSLRFVKKDITEALKGSECGMSFDGFQGMEPGDIVQSYVVTEQKRKIQ
ncbi:hypothetical protein HK102_000823 [Quaeritorhiza haematococci]|nr:hypothetical protein HK102_000823 [Quaeritorhiza haematococci]